MRAKVGAAAAGAAVVAGAVLLAIAAGAPAVAAVCGEPPPAASVEIDISELEVVFDHRRSKAELTRLASQEYGYGHAEGHVVFGLTTGRMQSRLAIETAGRERSDGVYCIWPTRVVASIVFDGPLTVHVAREYPKGTCQHRAVLKHEMEHVEVYEASLRDYQKRLRRALEQALRKGGFPATDRDRDQAAGEIRDKLQPAFERAIAEAQSERDRRNASLDSPEGYRRARDLCDTW